VTVLFLPLRCSQFSVRTADLIAIFARSIRSGGADAIDIHEIAVLEEKPNV
jgi:hypothetical protein